MAASLVAPASASAAPTVYGGTGGPDPTPFVLQLHPGDVDPVGMVAFDFTVSCPGFDRFTDISDALPLVSPRLRPQTNVLYSGPVSADGDWRASGIVSYRIGSYDMDVDETITGKMTGNDATGTFRAKAKLYSRRAGKRDIECRRARYKWKARSAPGLIFAGTTGDRLPIVIEVGSDGTSIRRARVSGWAECRGGLISGTASLWRNFPLDSDGTFELSSPYSYRDSGIRYRGREAIRGTINGLVVRGAFSDRWKERHANGDTDRCATGSVRYKARTSPVTLTPPDA
jgi:hypothetical protein